MILFLERYQLLSSMIIGIMIFGKCVLDTEREYSCVTSLLLVICCCACNNSATSKEFVISSKEMFPRHSEHKSKIIFKEYITESYFML